MGTDILVVSARAETWTPLMPLFDARGYAVRRVDDAAAGLAAVRAAAPRLVVLDLDLNPEALRQAVIDILTINAAVHTAAVTSMDDAAFHDAMEGLGMLMPLPPTPGATDVLRLVHALEALG